MRAEIYIGIDTGVNTGVAIWNAKTQKFEAVETCKIHRAIELVGKLHRACPLMVRVEDARLRKWYGKAGRERLQGAGSVKRDASIWEDFLNDLGVRHELVAPASNRTKLDAKTFAKVTGYTGSTNEHSRDAAMLVYGIK